MVLVEEIDAAGVMSAAHVAPERMGGHGLTPPAHSASVAAAAVLAKGGTMEQAEAAAREASGRGKTVPTVPTDREMMMRYARAVARLGHGRFEELSGSDLADVLAVVPCPVRGFDDWLEAVSG